MDSRSSEMRRFAAFAFVMSALALSSAALADKLSPPQKAVDSIVRFCVDTGATADKLEAVLKPLRLPRESIQVEQQGNIIDMRLRLDHNQRIELNYQRGGNVAMCTYRTYLEDAQKTFELAKKRFNLKGRFDDYGTTKVNIEPIASPPGSSLFAFARVTKLDTDSTGTFTFNVLVDPPAN